MPEKKTPWKDCFSQLQECSRKLESGPSETTPGTLAPNDKLRGPGSVRGEKIQEGKKENQIPARSI